MIPLYKLEKLPRIQKFRKIAKFFAFAENRLCAADGKGIEIFSDAELVFFAEAAKLLEKDELFSHDACREFGQAKNVFEAAVAANTKTALTSVPLSALAPASTFDNETALFRRALNSVKHILLSETGRDQSDWDFTCSDGQLDSQKRQVFEGMFVYLEDIRSPFNVGAMFRTAESFGAEKIILSPFCADPCHKRAQRTAMGCIDMIPWERQDLFSTNDTPTFDYPVFALETGGIPLADFTFPRRGLLIAGSEELGVSPRALAAADASLGRVSIPRYGVKASLNVSVAFGIAMQAWTVSMHKNC